MKRTKQNQKTAIAYINNTSLDTRGKMHEAILRAIANGGSFSPEDNLSEVLTLTCPNGVWIVNLAE